MIKMLSCKVTILLLIVSMLTSVLACGGGGSSSPTPIYNPESTSSTAAGNLESAQAQQITAIGQANTEEQRVPAIEKVVLQGFTLGLVDENGNQLNPNVPADSLSLTPEDVAAHAAMIPGGNYRTINYVVDSLAEAGIVLASTDEVITLEDFLPDLQVYVDRSFANPDDPESSLGLLIGSGYELEVPNSAPTIDGETMINPLASLMMIADILLGVEEAPSQDGDDIVSKVLSVFTDDAYAEDKQNFASKVEGHITTTKEIFSKEQAKNIVAYTELGNRFFVRILDYTPQPEFEDTIKEIGIVKCFLFEQASLPMKLKTVVWSKKKGMNVQVFEDAPTSFTLTLFSPGNQLGQPLYPDADAELTGSGDCLIDQNGHLLYSQPSHNGFFESNITATQLPSEVARAALLLATAEIPADQITHIEAAVVLLGSRYTPDKELWKNKLSTIQPAPWVCSVVLEKAEDVVCDKKKDSDGIVWFDGCTLNGQYHGLCKIYYENGDITSEGYYNEGVLDGSYTKYYSRPAGAKQCEAIYADGELEWEKCYFSDGSKWTEAEYVGSTGSGKSYYRSGRIKSECNYTSSGGECQSYCDNDAKTLCGENEFDEDGNDIGEVWDACDSICSGNPPS
ncbi:MAG: hypothetical protein HQ553_12340 [Chloroflexi bacterium]|nr:hypothetical protein [Chloroflexota bacterium]